MSTTAEEAWRAPTVPEGEPIVFDEPGRIVGRVDYRSHHYRLAGDALGYTLFVRHGGGDESMKLPLFKNGVELLRGMDSDARYLMLNALYRAHRDGMEIGRSETAREFRQAFADGRLKKRKVRGQANVKVWILPARGMVR